MPSSSDDERKWKKLGKQLTFSSLAAIDQNTRSTYEQRIDDLELNYAHAYEKLSDDANASDLKSCRFGLTKSDLPFARRRRNDCHPWMYLYARAGIDGGRFRWRKEITTKEEGISQ